MADLLENKNSSAREWACGAAGSALPWHGRGHRFDPDQVHQIIRFRIINLQGSPEQKASSDQVTEKALNNNSAQRACSRSSKKPSLLRRAFALLWIIFRLS